MRQKEALTSSGDVSAAPAASKEPDAGSSSAGADGAGPSSAGGSGEGVEKAPDVLVELRDVDAAVREMFDSPHIKVRSEHLGTYLSRPAGAYIRFGGKEEV